MNTNRLVVYIAIYGALFLLICPFFAILHTSYSISFTIIKPFIEILITIVGFSLLLVAISFFHKRKYKSLKLTLSILDLNGEQLKYLEHLYCDYSAWVNINRGLSGQDYAVAMELIDMGYLEYVRPNHLISSSQIETVSVQLSVKSQKLFKHNFIVVEVIRGGQLTEYTKYFTLQQADQYIITQIKTCIDKKINDMYIVVMYMPSKEVIKQFSINTQVPQQPVNTIHA